MIRKTLNAAWGLILVLAFGLLMAKEPSTLQQMVRQMRLYHSAQPTYVQTMVNVGNWGYWVNRAGCTACYLIASNGGGIYPRGTTNIIFTDGFIWGGFVMEPDATVPDTSKDYLKTPLRVGGQTYVIGTQAGWIITPGQITGPGPNDYTPPVAVSDDNDRARIYRIRRDWESLKPTDAEVIRDAAEINKVSIGEVTPEMAQAVIDQYATDWNEWPVDLGAPFYDVNHNGVYEPGLWIDLNEDGKEEVGEVEEPGLAGADQVVWFVANDMNGGNTAALYGSPPIGVEIQVTLWAYNQPGATLGQIVYKRLRLINKSGLKVDSMYISQWSDPDVGNFSDDLAGNDRERSLGFAYSGNLIDDQYKDFNLPPGAVGYDFFQGPIISSEGDTAIFDLRKRPDYRNLPMTAFGFFAAGSTISDPPLGNYVGTVDWFKMFKGFIPTHDTNLNNLSPYVHGFGPLRGQPTKFPLDGDPFRLTGDIDGFGDNLPPGDRRIFLNSGPFTLMPGDTQEVVLAVVGGIIPQAGGTNRNAVEQMKLNDDFAQFIFDNLFEGIPAPPPAPKVTVAVEADKAVLEWGSDLDAVNATEKTVKLGFKFEGYNVYQLPNRNATKEQAKLIATFDVDNTITKITARKFVPEFGDILEVPIHIGRNTGIQRFFVVDKDFINDRPLFAGTPYYFAVTAYNAADADDDGVVDQNIPEPSLESALNPIEIIPQPPQPGVKFHASGGDELPVEHVSGKSDGVVKTIVVNPAKVTGHKYQVFFETETDSSSPYFGQLVWNVMDVDANRVVLPQNQPQVSDVETHADQPLFDGLQVRVAGPPLAIKSWDYESGDPSPLYPDYDRGRWFTGGGHGGSALFGGLFIWENFWGSSAIAPGDLVPIKVEWTPMTDFDDWDGDGAYTPGEPYRFDTNEGQNAFMYITWGGGNYEGFFPVPFKVFDVSDPDNPRQLNVIVRDRNANLQWDLHTDPFTMTRTPQFGGDQIDIDTRFNYVFIMATDYDPNGQIYDPNQGGLDIMEKLVSADDRIEAYYAMWLDPRGSRPMLAEAGTLSWVPNLINTVDDKFEFQAPVVEQSVELAKADVEKINVFPNPYYAFNPNEPNRFDRFVTFNHLPKKVKIRIFNLAGTLVRTLEKDNESQFLKWDLKNESGLPVASGIYFAHVEMPDLKKTKVLKVFIVQAQQILEFF